MRQLLQTLQHVKIVLAVSRDKILMRSFFESFPIPPGLEIFLLFLLRRSLANKKALLGFLVMVLAR